MSANVQYFGTSVDTFQAAGTTLSWWFVLGDNTSFWGWSARPAGANMSVGLEEVITSADNLGTQVTHLIVNVIEGSGNINFTAIGVSP
jgi:hypothetical protein